MGEVTREAFESRARTDPYGHMPDHDLSFIADTFEIIPLDATKADELDNDMSWAEMHIGLGDSLLCVTDYGRHRGECDDLGEFADMIEEEIRDTFGRQYLKIMDDEKEQVADTLLAVSRSNGYVVVPYWGETGE